MRARLNLRALQLFPSVIWALLASGCAIHYRNDNAGREYLLGIGKLEQRSELLNDQLAIVKTSAKAPGLVLGLGSDLFGISLGYRQSQRAFMTQRTNRVPETGHVGWFNPIKQVRYPARHGSMRASIITGRALVGLSAELRESRQGLSLRVIDELVTTVNHPNSSLTLTTRDSGWPQRDIFKSTFSIAEPTNSNEP